MYFSIGIIIGSSIIILLNLLSIYYNGFRSELVSNMMMHIFIIIINTGIVINTARPKK